MAKFAIPTNEAAFSAQCDHCEKFYFRSDVRDAVIKNRKTGESDTFRLCQKCRSDLAQRIADDTASVYGITGELYRSLEALHKSTVRCAISSRGRKAHTISVGDLVKLWLIQSGRCALTGRAFVLDGDNNEAPSVDRIDSLGSYTMGNIQLVCQIVNIMKNAYPMADFIEVCMDVARQKAEYAIAA